MLCHCCEISSVFFLVQQSGYSTSANIIVGPEFTLDIAASFCARPLTRRKRWLRLACPAEDRGRAGARARWHLDVCAGLLQSLQVKAL